MTRRRLLALFGCALPALAVAACGKKGAPKHPEGSRYPRTHPSE